MAKQSPPHKREGTEPKYKAKEWLRHLVFKKITNNTSHNIRS